MNLVGSINPNTRLNVSCEGIPCGNASQVLNQSALQRPHSAISVKPSAPQSMAQTAINRMSSNSWRLARPTRGSASWRKWSWRLRDEEGMVCIPIFNHKSDQTGIQIFPS